MMRALPHPNRSYSERRTDEQNDAIVADYSAMLDDDLAGRACSTVRGKRSPA
jgi:hypothetical protein